MHLREALLKPAQHLAKPIERQFGMQSADNMELGDRFAPAFPRAMPHFFERHGIGLGIAHALSERAQPATRHAHVRRIDVAVDVEIGGVAVHALAHQVGHIAERQNIGGAIKRHAHLQTRAARPLPPFRG